MSDKKKKGYDDYECKHFAETLMEAEAIKADPKKMAAVDKHLKKMKKEINSIEDLRQVRNEMIEEDDES